MIKRFFGNPLSSTNHRTNRQAGRRTGRSATKLSVESLENRIVLTGTPGTASVVDGVLFVCGNANANTIVVAELADNYFVAADFLQTNQLFPKSQVNQVVVTGGEGDDTLVASSFQTPVTLAGEGGSDRLFGGQSNDRLEGGPGDDLIYGTGGNDVVIGGDGADRVFAGDGNDIVNAGHGDDLVQGNAGNDTVNGEAGNDLLSGSGGSDTIIGGVGDDTLLGGAGNDTLRGNAGNDTLVGEGDADELQGEAGDDTLLGSGGADVLLGGLDRDRLVGGNGDDFLDGGAAADILFGDAGTDSITGGFGDDSEFGGTGPDLMFGNEGNDTLIGGDGFDILVGNSGEDQLFGGGFQDVLIGGLDADLVNGQGSEDLVIGGSVGNDLDIHKLESIRSVWISSESFDDRVESALSGNSVSHDSSVDSLAGGNGRDAFVAASTSELTDQQGNEPLVSQFVAAADDNYLLPIGQTINTNSGNGVLANDTAIDGDAPTATLITDALHGAVTLNADGSFSYTQTSHGRDYFVYEVTNSTGLTSQATVRIEVPNLPPLPDGEFLTTTSSGLQYYDFVVGSGAMPVRANTVTVDYVGFLPDGTIFDSNQNINFPLGNLIEGFAEGVEGMLIGGMRRIVIPPDLGYGPGGNPGAGIGGTDIITFDVTLDGIL